MKDNIFQVNLNKSQISEIPSQMSEDRTELCVLSLLMSLACYVRKDRIGICVKIRHGPGKTCNTMIILGNDISYQSHQVDWGDDILSKS